MSFNKKFLNCFIYISLSIALPNVSLGHGFNANRVHIAGLPNGNYRIYITYTHVELGEYREAHIDYSNKAEALKAYQDLVNGADFFLGDAKSSIHFHNPVQKNRPY